MFRIEVNHVKSVFFFASKRNEIFASFSNFASEAKVRAHPKRDWPQQPSQVTWPLTTPWDCYGLSHWHKQSSQVAWPLTTRCDLPWLSRLWLLTQADNDLSNQSSDLTLWPGDGTYQGYLVCGTLYMPGNDLSNPTKWPLTRGWDLTGLSRLRHLTQVWDWPQQSSRWPPTRRWNIQVILSVAPYSNMGLTSAIQPSDLTCDYVMELANYHGYPFCRTFHRYYTGTDLSNPAGDLWPGDGTYQGYPVCGTLHRNGTDLSNPAGDLWPGDGMDLPVHEAVQSIVDPEGLVTREDAVPAEDQTRWAFGMYLYIIVL